MTRRAIVINSVNIRRMPGFMNGGFALSGLSPHVNVLYGPNGIGKTTSAKVIEEIFWQVPKVSNSSAFNASLSIGNESWVIDQDGHVRLVQCDGNTAVLPVVPSRETRDRYKLAFHDLLVDKNTTLAQHVIRESLGGYDVKAAVEKCGYHPNISIPRSAVEAHATSQKEYREAVDLQKKLVLREEQLKILEVDLSKAETATASAESLKKAVEYHEACEEERGPLRQMRLAPRSLSKIRPEDLQVIDDHAAAVSTLLTDMRMSRREHRLAHEKRRQTGLHRVSVTRQQIDEVRIVARQIEQAESSLDAAVRTTGEASAREERGRGNLSPNMSTVAVESLDREGLLRVAQVAKCADELRGPSSVRSALIECLRSTPNSVAVHNIYEAERSLLAWLSHPAAASTNYNRAKAAVSILAACGAASILYLALSGHPAWILLLGGVVVGVIFGWPKSTMTASDKSSYETDYARTGLSVPKWNEANVHARLEEVRAQIAANTLDQAKKDRMEALVAQYADLDTLSANFEKDLAALRRDYGEGVVIEGAKNGLLYQFAERLVTWREAQAGLDAANASESIARSVLGSRIEAVNGRLAALGAPGVGSSAAALASADNLAANLLQFENANRDISIHFQQIKDLIVRIRQHRKDQQLVYDRLGIQFGERSEVESLAAKQRQYEDLRRAYMIKRTARRVAKGKLIDSPGLVRCEIGDLRAKLAFAQEQAARRDNIRDEIGDIRNEIDRRKCGHDIEESLNAIAQAEEKLDSYRSAEYANQAGLIVSEYVRNETRASSRPEIFNRASDLFTRITRGQYRLEISDDAEFRAIDNVSGHGFNLDELSSGTRVQLLIATRVAFISELESEYALPLVFDEALANSDEERAGAIIEAVIELCAEGRQVFYLTARHDEVEKWRSLCENKPDLELALLNLAELRNIQSVARVPRLHFSLEPIPSPTGSTMLEYVEILNIPGIDPRSDVSAVDLCYLLDDPQDAYSLRKQYGAKHWGGLVALKDAGLLTLDDDLYSRICARAAVVATLVQLWRLGRPNPVALDAIMQSGADCGNFTEQILDLLRQCNGDGGKFVAGLRRGDIPRFRANKIDVIESFLANNGYLSDEDRVSHQGAVSRTLAACSEEIKAGRLTFDDINRLATTIHFD